MANKKEKRCAGCSGPMSRKNKTYCSYKCHGKSRDRSGVNNPKWRGGRVHLHGGRYGIYMPGHPMANVCGGVYVLEYRLIAAKKIGRLLRNDEVVHHKNGDPTDNRPENLEVLSQSEHSREHANERRDIVTGRFLSNANRKA